MDTNLMLEMMRLAAKSKGGGASIDFATVALILGALMPTITSLAAYIKAKAVQTEMITVKTDVKSACEVIISRLDRWPEKDRDGGVMEERKSVADAADSAVKEKTK